MGQDPRPHRAAGPLPAALTCHADGVDVESDRTYRFDTDRVAVWDAIGRVDDYRGWWPWLRSFDAAGLAAGETWRCTVSPPVPYALRFEVELVEVEVHERIEAVVTGDIGGHAVVTLRPDGPDDSSTEVRLVSSLEPRRTLLTGVTRLAPWLSRFGHDWVLDTGLRQFRRRAL